MGQIRPLLGVALILFPFEDALAKDIKQNFFDLGASADFRSTDNTKKTSNELAKIEEVQSIYSFDMAGYYHNDWLELDSRYDTSKSIYDKKSQIDKHLVEGTSQLLIGNESFPLDLRLAHSKMTLLNSPDAVDISDNLDSREILSVMPSVKTHLSSADLIVFTGNYDETSYKDNLKLNSDRKGFTASWLRGISKVENLQVSVQKLDSSFDYFPSADYQLVRASAQFDVKLRNLSYMIQAGYNKATRDIEDNSFSNPEYKFLSTYIMGSNEFGLSISQAITDSSYGNGNVAGLVSGEGLGGRDSSAVVLDLINEQRVDLSWRTTAFCEHCYFGLNLIDARRDYQKTSQDRKEKMGSVDFRYKFSQKISYYVHVRYSEMKFDSNVQFSNYKHNNASTGFDYSLTKDFKIKMYAEKNKRTSTSLEQSYTENILGLNLSYNF